MENKPTKNGHAIHPGPPFAVISTTFAILPYVAVMEMLEMNAAQQAKGNLAMGPLFRLVADDFRAFAKIAEPGSVFRAEEVKLCIIRLSAFAPMADSMSDEARKAAVAPETELKIALP